MAMIYFKVCEICNGDLVLEEGSYGAFYECLQCGRLTEINVRETGVAQTRPAKKVRIAA